MSLQYYIDNQILISAIFVKDEAALNRYGVRQSYMYQCLSSNEIFSTFQELKFENDSIKADTIFTIPNSNIVDVVTYQTNDYKNFLSIYRKAIANQKILIC